MFIAVINGSPKGKYSITLQTVNFLQKKHSEHTFEIINASSGIRKYERDFSEAKEILKRADLILFSYPVYTFIAPSQLHRFVELMKQSGMSFENKYVTQITTSKHFYDVTAHRYIEDNCRDMKMRIIKGFTADMDDLLTEQGQRQALSFFDYVEFSIRNGLYERDFKKYTRPKHRKVTVPVYASARKTDNGDIVIVTDLDENDRQLSSMISRFRKVFPKNTRVVNLRDFKFKGGCLGCLNCATDGKCIYTDNFESFLREKIQTADSIVYAFSIKDHSMGTLFKTYDDRQFCNGHRTVTMGMPTGYIVSGNYSEEENLRMIIEGRANAGGNFLAGVATDEFDPDRDIDALAQKLNYALDNKLTQPSNFLGVGGMKIFRDLIYQMRGMMKEDHKFFKEHGQYDFPHNRKGRTALMYLLGAVLSNDKIKSKMGNMMNEGMLMPYKNLFKEEEENEDRRN